MTWLPIELAPRDGTAILAIDGFDPDETVSVVRFWDGQWWVSGGGSYCLAEPEWWQHVPSGPDGQRWGPKSKQPNLVVVPNPEPPHD